jgi:threonine/homoserine/homoserine lactone efflux protein
VALGAGEVLAASPALQAALRWLGAAWMVWLAWKIASAAPPEAGAEARGRPMTLLQAALFQWVNPKAWVIAGAAILAYGASLLLAAIFALAAFASLYLWALVGLGAARLLRSPAALRWFNRAMAALLLLSLVPVLRG